MPLSLAPSLPPPAWNPVEDNGECFHAWKHVDGNSLHQVQLRRMHETGIPRGEAGTHRQRPSLRLLKAVLQLGLRSIDSRVNACMRMRRSGRTDVDAHELPEHHAITKQELGTVAPEHLW